MTEDGLNRAGRGRGRDLRAPRWSELAGAARTMAGAYMRAPVPGAGRRTRAMLTRLVAIAFLLSLALYRPYVRYWSDPRDRRRQIIVAVVPRRAAAVPVLRLVPAVALFAAAVLVLPTLMPTAVLSLSMLVLTVLAAATP